MIDNPIARDYSHVKVPVLSFLIAHELFRIELAEQVSLAPKSRPVRYPKEPQGDRDTPAIDECVKLLLKHGPMKTRDIAYRRGQTPATTICTLKGGVQRGKIIKMGSRSGGGDRSIWWKVA